MARIFHRYSVIAVLYENPSQTLKELTEAHKGNLSEASLHMADLEGADLMWANLRAADLSLARLAQADIRDASLCEAKRSESDLGYSLALES